MKNYWEKGEEYAPEVDNIRQDYIATSDTFYQFITDWKRNFDILIKLQNKSKRNQKKEASGALKLTKVEFSSINMF